MISRLSFLLLFSLLAWGEGLPKAPPTLDQLLRGVKAEEFGDRLDAFSAAFLGTPYLAAPLGEGPRGKYDQGPLYRFDAFDCTTLVETVVALSLSREAAQFSEWMRKIRYRDGHVGFLERNHFPCGDWTPNNILNGLLTDITAKLAGPLGTKLASAVETKKEWVVNLPPDVIRLLGVPAETRERHWQMLKKEAARLSPQHVSLPYLSLEVLLIKHAVAPEEAARRQKEEAELRAHLQQQLAAEPDATKREATTKKEVYDLKLKYLIQDAEVDGRFLNEIPGGTLINFVRPNYSVPGTRLLISHQGLVFRKKGVPYFRHVSLSGGGRTKDVPLANYLRLCLLNPAIHGIQVLQINDLRRKTKN